MIDINVWLDRVDLLRYVVANSKYPVLRLNALSKRSFLVSRSMTGETTRRQ